MSSVPDDGGAVARRPGQAGRDGLSGQLGGRDHVGRQSGEHRLFFPAGRRVDPLVDRGAEARLEIPVERPRVPTADRGDLGREQIEDDAVLVRGPGRPVPAQEGGAGAFLAAEAEGAVE